MHDPHIPSELLGWWRITQTSQWVDNGLDLLGPALLSVTGAGDRLRLYALLADVEYRPAASKGLSFFWHGVWEFDRLSGTGSLRLAADDVLHGRISIQGGDKSTFLALRTSQPDEPIPETPRFIRKCRR